MTLIKWYEQLSLSKRIYISTAIGFCVGMFFGDRCIVLESFNILFIKIFQITIIPYMIFTLIKSIGSIDKERAGLLAKKWGIWLLILWGVSIVFAFGLQFSFPDIPRSKFFNPLDTMGSSDDNLFDLFIPTNPFYSISRGYIPAIVIFCVLVGVALMAEKRKSAIIESADIWASLMKKINDYITLLLPLGVLVMSSYTFGTLSIMKLKGIMLYMFAGIFYLVFISMIVYPAIMTSVSRINYRKFMKYTMPAVLVAFTTGSVFLALPVIYNQMFKFDEEEKGFSSFEQDQQDRGNNIIRITVPFGWVVPASYKFLVIFFIVFAHWYYGSSGHFFRYLFYYLGGIPCLFGSNSAIVPFLIQITSLPNKAFDIFMLVSNFLVYFNNANAAIFIMTLTMLAYLSISGNLKVKLARLLATLAGCVIIFVIFVTALNMFMTQLLSNDTESRLELLHMNTRPFNPSIYNDIKVEYLTLDKYKPVSHLDKDETLLEIMYRTRTLQVGFNPQAMPFSFFNKEGVLVGYDIDFVYKIASAAGCNKIEFYSINNADEYQECIEKGMDIAICAGGFTYHIPTKDVTASKSYMKLTPSVAITREVHNQYKDFESVELAIEEGKVKACYFFGAKAQYNRFYADYSRKYNIQPINNYFDYYGSKKFDALLTSAETAYVINMFYPGHWIYIYPHKDLFFFFAYLMPSENKAETFRSLINDIIDFDSDNGISKQRYNYWILGQADLTSVGTWSVLSWLQKNTLTSP